MKDSKISFTIPLEPVALNIMVETLQGLATKLSTTGDNIGGIQKVEEKPVAPAPVASNSEESIYTSPGSIEEQQAAIAAANLKKQQETPPGVDTDSTGLPHDARIHSSSKTKLVRDETWKKKRGIDPALVEQVEAELRAAMAAPAATETTAAAAFAETEKPAPAPAAKTETPAPAPAAKTETPAPAPAATIEPVTFPILMSKVTNAMAAGTLTEPQILQAVNAKGLASLPLLSARPDLITEVDALLFPVA